MLAGGSDSNLEPLSYEGFHRLRALSTSPDPLTASRPFDKDRSGFVIAEGACVLVLEELSYALARNAPIIAEVTGMQYTYMLSNYALIVCIHTGYGLSADAHHITSPSPDGSGAIRSMQGALTDAGLRPDDIGYINAHATSTPMGDRIESEAIESLFASSTRSAPLYVSSTKGATGHLLGAAGALESAFCCLSLRDGVIPPTLNLTEPTPLVSHFTHVPNRAIYYSIGEPLSPTTSTTALSDSNSINNISEKNKGHNSDPSPRILRHVLKNSFGFGGTNASLIFSRYVP